MSNGYLALHLHAHLPFIRHPEHPEFLEERWFFDAIVDTYVPLLSRFQQLHSEGTAFRLSMTLSPSLLSMMADEVLQHRFATHLAKQQQACDQEQQRVAGDPQFEPVLAMYSRRLHDVQRQFARYGGNLALGFRELAEQGHLDIVTCGATHGFLPHMQLVPGAVERQLRFAVETHERILHCKPDGIWLPESAYYPGLEDQLLKHELIYCFVDTHALHLGNPRSLRGVHSHTYTRNGVAFFARDAESSKQVWSAEEGYPGDGLYRDFYRDIGFDLPLDYVRPFIHDGNTRILTGFKYYAITGATEHKNVYDPAAAQAKAQEHAYNFVWCREQQVNWLNQHLDRPPVIVSPYDAELFGHWWYEGPDFLYWTLKAAAENNVVRAATVRDYMLKFPNAQVLTPNASSWGDGGYYRVWLNGGNEWIYPHLNAAARMMPEPAPSITSEPWLRRAMLQAERELLLAQASDWAFIMTTGTSPSYATQQTMQHLYYLGHLRDRLAAGRYPELLDEMEQRDTAF